MASNNVPLHYLTTALPTHIGSQGTLQISHTTRQYDEFNFSEPRAQAMDHERLCYGRSWPSGSWYVQDDIDFHQHLTESTKDFGDIPHRKSRPLITGFDWPNTWTRTAFTASSSQISWVSTTCTKMGTRPCSQDRRYQFSMSACSSQPWPTPPRISPLALPLPPRTRTLILLRGSLPRSIILVTGGSDGTL